MQNFQKKLITVTVICAAVIAPTAALATNGYFAHGYGTKNKGLVGAGVALPQDSMIAATNPAGMVMVGERLDVGAAIFSPSPRSYRAETATAPGHVNGSGLNTNTESENDFFLIPHVGYNMMLDANSSAGISVYGNGGMNTRWMPDTTPGGAGIYGGGEAGVDLKQLFINGTYARKFSDKGSWGASLILAYQEFEAKGLSAFGGFSNDAANLSDNGVSTSTGFGIKMGVQTEVTPGISVGASYQSEMAMSEFDDYAGLFAENGDFDIPSTITVGLAWETSPKSTLVLDIQKIMYSDISAIANPASNLAGCGGGDTTQCLGGSNGAGFGWEDMTIVKLGYQWEMSDMIWRVGFSSGDQPIPDTEMNFNILAPAVVEEHVTFGLTKAMDKNSEINFALMYAPENTVTGNPTTTQQVELEMTQLEVELSYGMKF